MDLGFAGSTAVVTGGSKGMGLAIAETLAAEGASVAVMARGTAALDAAVTSLREAGAPDAVGINVDMADADSIAAGFAAVSDRWGRLNSLVHTIGPSDGYFEQMDDAEWDAAFALGTMSAVRSIRASLPLLRSADWARIVTLSAHSIQRQNPRIVAYTASKAALASVTKNLSKSLAVDGILVNCVCPGTIVTASFTEALSDGGEAGGDGRRIGHVHADAHGIRSAGLPKFLRGGIECCLAPRHHRDAGALGRQGLRDGQAHPFTTAGDNGFRSGEFQVHGSPRDQCCLSTVTPSPRRQNRSTPWRTSARLESPVAQCRSVHAHTTP